MAIRNIVTKEQDVLRKKCRTVEKFDERLWTLLDDMKDTLYKANTLPAEDTLRRDNIE